MHGTTSPRPALKRLPEQKKTKQENQNENQRQKQKKPKAFFIGGHLALAFGQGNPPPAPCCTLFFNPSPLLHTASQPLPPQPSSLKGILFFF
jgi:hypothetical protein